MDYLGAESSIVERLQTRLAANSIDYPVGTALDWAQVTDAAQLAPHVFVLYAGDREVKPLANGRQVAITQVWQIVLAMRAVRQRISGPEAHSEAGRILTAIVQALTGWTPTGNYSALAQTRAGAVRAEPGVIFYPLAFTTTFKLFGARK